MSTEKTAIIPFDGTTDLAMSTAGYEHAWRLAQTFAESQLVPQHLQGKPHDCMIALFMADAMGENPLVVMQAIHIIKGKAGWSAQYVIARANRSGVFRGRINWREKGEGDSLTVTAYATLADTGEEVEFPVPMSMAKAEGWTSNPKYRSMPKLMLRYRSAVFLVRLYAPEIMLGYQSVEEIETTPETVPVTRLADALAAQQPAPKPTPAEIQSLRSTQRLAITQEQRAEPEAPKPELAPTEPAPDDDVFGLADDPPTDEKPATPPAIVKAIGVRKAARECKAMEDRLPIGQRGTARIDAGAPGLGETIKSTWDAGILDSLHQALSGLSAPVDPDEPTPDEPETPAPDERTSLIDAITPLEADVSERQYSELRELMGIDSGPDALHTTELGNLKELLRRLKDNAGSPAPEPSTSHDVAPV